MKRLKYFCLLLSVVGFISQVQAQITVQETGEKRKWHNIKLMITLPNSLRENTGTFTNHRVDVVCQHSSGTTLRIPAYFAANGNAANTQAKSGKIWIAHFRPNKTGNWTYRVLYYQANNVAVSAVNTLPAPVQSTTPKTISIANSNKGNADFRKKGRLRYQTTGTKQQRRYLQFADSKEFFLKLGPDSPENLLDYVEFDFDDRVNNCGLCSRHQWQPHVKDYDDNKDPFWGSSTNKKGKGIIGAMNYLHKQKMNSVSMSLFGGDDKNVFPWTKVNQKTVFDVSKLAQWQIVLNHAERQGLMLHLKLAEAENWSALNSFQIKLYYREMVARFGHHLALEWNVSEEYGGGIEPNTAAKRAEVARTVSERINFLASIDPYQNLRVIHTYPGRHDMYNEWLKPAYPFTGASIQSNSRNNYIGAYPELQEWVTKSTATNTPWVVSSDEQNPGSNGMFTAKSINVSTVLPEARTRMLWPTLMAGGAGIMWYGGGEGDFKTENYNRFNTMFTWTRYAILDFFKGQNIKFWQMQNQNNLVAGNNGRNFCLAELGKNYVVYLENGGNIKLDLSGQSGRFSVQWFDPRNGGTLINRANITGGGKVNLGNPPNNTNKDWVVLVSASSGSNVSVTGVTISPTNLSLAVGQTRALNATITPTNATNQSVSWTSSNTNVATVNPNGVVTAVNAGNATITCTTNNGNFTATSTLTVTAGTGCTSDYEEVGGMVIMEAENLKVAGTDWKVESNVAGFTGGAYINWTGPNSFGRPGLGVITTTIRINTPGKYQFQWRSKVGKGTNSTEHNDSWLRFSDASAFYGEKNGSRVYPRGTGLTPNPKGSSADGWFKIYLSGTTNWTWRSSTSDNDAHSIFVEFDSPGVYTMEISGRSQSHFIDRIALYRTGNGTNLSNPETPCNGNTSIAVTGLNVTPKSVSLEVGQTTQLNATVSPANATDQSVSWTNSNSSI